MARSGRRKDWGAYLYSINEAQWPLMDEVDALDAAYSVTPIDPMLGDRLAVEACPTLDYYDGTETED